MSCGGRSWCATRYCSRFPPHKRCIGYPSRHTYVQALIMNVIRIDGELRVRRGRFSFSVLTVYKRNGMGDGYSRLRIWRRHGTTFVAEAEAEYLHGQAEREQQPHALGQPSSPSRLLLFFFQQPEQQELPAPT